MSENAKLRLAVAAMAGGYLGLMASLFVDIFRSSRRSKAAYEKVRESVQTFLDENGHILDEEHKEQFREMGYEVV